MGNTPYGPTLIDHFRNPRNKGRLAAPTISHEGTNPLCGDRVRIELQPGFVGVVVDLVLRHRAVPSFPSVRRPGNYGTGCHRRPTAPGTLRTDLVP